MSKDVLHVVPQDENWGVKREGNERFSSTHSTQKEAIDSARNLAHDGDDIVIHRTDGTIRERLTYSEAASGNGTGQAPSRPQPHDVISVGSRVSWQAVLAGLAVAFTVYVCLMLLALAIGVSTMDGVENRTIAVVAIVNGVVSLLAAMFLGGFVTSRLSTRETPGEAVVYGVLLWAAFFFALLVTGINLGGSVGQMAQIIRPSNVEVRAADRAAPKVSLTEPQGRRAELLAPGEQLLAELDPVPLTWLAFGGMVFSVLAAILGALVGAGPALEFRHFFRAQAEAPPGVTKA